MKIENDIKLDFSDVLFRPKRSTLSSRSEVSLERTFTFKYSNQTWSGIPIISSNMDTISSVPMFKALSKYKCLTCFHKYIDINEVISACENDNCDPNYFILSTGILDKDYAHLNSNINMLKANNIEVKFICIDVANGYMFKLIDFCKKVRKDYPNVTLIAGNVVTREIVEELIMSGCIDIIKVGIGSGAVCTTRLQTGVGLPQFSAVLECSDAAHGLNGMIVSDGGICHPGDVSKAIGGGADFVMIGSMLAGHEECPGELIEKDTGKFKLFYGMSSETAMNKHHGGVAKYRSSEGKTVEVPYKGSVEDTIQNILGGMRSTCTYIGASKIKDISKCATFVRVNNQVNNFYK
jgi:GMP reductase|tara:strand:- start:975 stop:2024 length:1050 start_codon:yes stop_codon:yes gene_type:complete